MQNNINFKIFFDLVFAIEAFEVLSLEENVIKISLAFEMCMMMSL